MIETARLFDVTAETVIERAACTYCGAGCGKGCVEFKYGGWRTYPHTHAQRWRDYWNATHDRKDREPVYPAPWAPPRA